MIKLCAEPNCHTRINQSEIVCSLHKALYQLDEIQGEILEREAYVSDLATVDARSTCGCVPFPYACDEHDEPFTPEYPGREVDNPFEW